VLHSLVGDDMYGSIVVERIAELGVVLSAPRLGGQGVCFCLSGRTDRAFVSYKGTVGRFSESDIDTSVLLSPETDHVHFAAFFDCVGLQAAVPKLMRAAKQRGATVSLVTQADHRGEWDSGVQAILPLVDCLIVNASEAVCLARLKPATARSPTDAELEEALACLLHAGTELVVITKGQDGAIAGAAGARWEQPTMARNVVDTTGAGDAFAAGFLYGWVQKRDVRLGLIHGCACGAAAVGQMGGSTPLSKATLNECMLEETPTFSSDSTNGFPPRPSR